MSDQIATTIRFSPRTQSAIASLIESTPASSAADVIHDALSVYSWLAREREAGTRFLAQRGDVVTELVLTRFDGGLAPGADAEVVPDDLG